MPRLLPHCLLLATTVLIGLTPHQAQPNDGAPAQAPPTPVDVYILSGQSNMVDSGRYAELAQADKWIHEAFFFSKGKTDWDKMRPDTGLRD